MQKLHLSIPNTLWRKFKQSILLVAMLGLVTPVWAGVVQILQITGEACWFKLKRGSQEYGDRCSWQKNKDLPHNVKRLSELPSGFAPYALLQSGDEVCVIKPSKDEDPHHDTVGGKEYSITLSLGSSTQELTYNTHNCKDNPPRYFQIPVPTKGVLEPLWPILQSFWKYDTNIKQAVSQGDGGKPPLSIPLLSGSTAKLVKKDKVYLGWYGGTPPYKVQVLLDGKPVKLVYNNCTSQPEIEVTGVTLNTGRYIVQVFDSTSCDSTPLCNDPCYSNKPVIEEFTVVDTKALPKSVSVVENEKVGASGSELPLYSQKILPALLMLKDNQETWSFEAYQLAKSVLDKCVEDKNVTNNKKVEDKNTPPAPCYSAYLLMRGLKEGWK